MTGIGVLKLINLIESEGVRCNHPSLDAGSRASCKHCSPELLDTCENADDYSTLEQAKKEMSEIDSELLFEILI